MKGIVMPGKIIKTAMIAYLFFNSALVVANGDTLKSLIEKGKTEAAYKYGIKNFEEHAGDPLFDLYFGISAIETGHIERAIMSFERILMIYPQQHRARLELGRAYFIIGNYERAKPEFEEILNTSAPESVKQKVKNFLDEIDKRIAERSVNFSAYIDFAVGHDSNINGATAYDEVYIPFFSDYFQLTEDSQAISSAFAELELGVKYERSISKISSWYTAASIANKSNSATSDYDTNLFNLSGGYSWRGNKNSFQVPLSLQLLTMDGEESRYSFSATAVWSRSLDKSTTFNSFWQIGSNNFPGSSDRDVDTSMLGLSLTDSEGRSTVSVNAMYAVEIPRGDALEHNGKSTASLGFSSRYIVSNKDIINMLISASIVEYDDASPLFDQAREDEMITLVLAWKRMYNRKIGINAEFMFTENMSNQDLYDYDRAILKTGIRYQFD